MGSELAIVSCFRSQNHSIWPKMAPKDPQRPQFVTYGYTRSKCTYFGAIQAFWIAKNMRNMLQTGQSTLLWTLKSLINGPKWPKVAKNGPQKPPKAPTNTVWLYSVPQYMFWGHSCLYGPKKWTPNWPKLAQIQ